MKIPAPRLAAPLVACVALTLASPVPASEIEEIVVRAQKRDQNAQDVGVTLTAIDKNQLESWRLAQLQESRLVLLVALLYETAQHAEGSSPLSIVTTPAGVPRLLPLGSSPGLPPPNHTIQCAP